MNGTYDKPDLLNGTNLIMNADSKQYKAVDVEMVKVSVPNPISKSKIDEPTPAYSQMMQEENSFDYWAEAEKKKDSGEITKDTLQKVGFVILAILLGFGLVIVGIVIFAGGIDKVKSWRELSADCKAWESYDSASKGCKRVCADNLFFNKEGKCVTCPTWTSYSADDNKCMARCSDKLLYVPDSQTTAYSCKKCKDWTALEGSTNQCKRICAADSVLNLSTKNCDKCPVWQLDKDNTNSCTNRCQTLETWDNGLKQCETCTKAKVVDNVCQD